MSAESHEHYNTLFPGVIWTALNIDYPGHSFSHVGVFYEGLNGRLPNQDVPNTLSHVGRWAGGVDMRLHDINNNLNADEYAWIPRWGREYWVAARHLWEHARYTALGRASAGHGVLAKFVYSRTYHGRLTNDRHRIDASTLYCTPATGPHGFHTLGRTLESTLRSLNNLLERLHASYFFYLLPRPGKFIPVGHYLPSAVLIGASITLGGFDCPEPLQGVLFLLPGYALALYCWFTQQPFFLTLILPWHGYMIGDRFKHHRRSAKSLMRLLYGALIPTLAMVNFPQAILLAALVLTADSGIMMQLLGVAIIPIGFGARGWNMGRLLPQMQAEWALGNVTYPAAYAVVIPLISALWCFSR